MWSCGRLLGFGRNSHRIHRLEQGSLDVASGEERRRMTTLLAERLEPVGEEILGKGLSWQF